MIGLILVYLVWIFVMLVIQLIVETIKTKREFDKWNDQYYSGYRGIPIWWKVEKGRLYWWEE